MEPESAISRSFGIGSKSMESSRALDVPSQSLPPETEKRLLRVFCFLRQHERMAKVARKVAELQKLRCASGALEPDNKLRLQFREEEQVSDHDEELSAAAGPPAEAAVLFDRSNLLDELNLLSPTADSRSKFKPRAAAGSESRAPVSKSNKTNNASVSTAVSTILPPTSHSGKGDHVLELSREIRELQKGILHASLDCTDVPGCITIGDILSAMKAMNRSASKVCVVYLCVLYRILGIPRVFPTNLTTFPTDGGAVDGLGGRRRPRRLHRLARVPELLRALAGRQARPRAQPALPLHPVPALRY